MTKEELENIFDLPTGLMSSERKTCALIMATRISSIYQDIIDITGNLDFENDYYMWNNIRKELNEELSK